MFTISTLESFKSTFYYIYDTVLYDIINGNMQYCLSTGFIAIA